MDVKKFILEALPWIGAAATGNVPMLVTLAANKVGEVLGTEVAADAQSIAEAVAGATPEQMVALRKANQDFEVRMREVGFKHVEELGRQALAAQTLFVTDTADARKSHAGNDRVFVLGCIILGSFAATVLAVLWGCFILLSGTKTFSGVDVGVIATVAGIIGSLIGYMAANAQQVVSFFFGSSQGSKEKTDAMGATLTEALTKLGSR